MSGRLYSNGNGEPNHRRMYRDPQHGVLFGVCAGIADYFGVRLGVVRILTVIAACLFAPFVLFVYFALAWLLPRKPDNLYRDDDERLFWQHVRRSPQGTFAATRHKFREMELRLQRMERYVTSRRFDLDREFRDLNR